MTSLYQLSTELRDMLDGAFDPETGEALACFEEHRALWGSKATGVAAYVLNIESDAAQAKAAIERIKTHMLEPAQRKADRLRDYLRENMAASGITEIKAVDGSFVAKLYPGRDESVEIFDAAQLPQDYLREIPAKYEPDKTLIKRSIADGFEVPGARLVKKDRLTIK